MEPVTSKEKVVLDGGKYEFFVDGGALKCLRNGAAWRDFVGDKAVHALFDAYVEAEQRIARLEAALMDSRANPPRTAPEPETAPVFDYEKFTKDFENTPPVAFPSMEGDKSPLGHLEILSAVAHHARELVKLTETVPVECSGQPPGAKPWDGKRVYIIPVLEQKDMSEVYVEAHLRAARITFWVDDSALTKGGE